MEETATHAAAKAVSHFSASQQPDSAGKTAPNNSSSSQRPDGAARKEVVAGTNASRPINSKRGTTHKQNINTRSSTDFLENVYKKSARCTVKVGKIMFKTLLRPIVRMMSQVVMATCLQPLTAHHNLKLHDFMTLIIKVDSSRRGWQKVVLAVLRKCEGARFKMDQNGVVEISGVGDPKRLLKKLGRSNCVNLLWFQFGQCSENLYMASSGKKSDPPAQESKQPIGYGSNTRFPFLPDMHAGFAYGSNTRFPFLPDMHAGFAHGYHPTPHFVTPYAPY